MCEGALKFRKGNRNTGLECYNEIAALVRVLSCGDGAWIEKEASLNVMK